MQGSKKQPATAPIRRDDRAEPDDDEACSSRIDVVNVDGPGSGSGGGPSSGSRMEGAASGFTSLKAQLARLNEQAAAVEKSLDDQRRDRSDALDRLERATERCIHLESHVTRLETETATLRLRHEGSLAGLEAMRTERDGLARSVAEAKEAAAELAELQAENHALHRTIAESMQVAVTFEAEIADLRERQCQEALKLTAQETELSALRTTLDRAASDAAGARTDAANAKADSAKAREAAAKADQEMAAALEEAMQAREAAAKAENAISVARGEGWKAREEASKAREEAASAREELDRLRQELATAKEDNTKDRATARGRIDLIERALDDARAATSRTEARLEASRTNEHTIATELEAAVARASAASSSQAALEQNVRRLREDIVGAFARLGHGAAPPPLPPAARSETRESLRDRLAREAPQSLAPEMLDSVPPSARSDLPPMPSISPHRPPPLEFDNDWSSPDPVPPPSGRPSSASPASKSVPPPPPSAIVSVDAERGPSAPPGSIPPPTYASVPPQVHDSVVPPRDAPATTPPPPRHSVPVPAAARGSTSPAKRESHSPEASRGSASAFPSRGGAAAFPEDETIPGGLTLAEITREGLLAMLDDPDHGSAAALQLKDHPEWLRSIPPMTLIRALQSVDYDADRPVFDLARLWEREPLCHALLGSLLAEPEDRSREHGAWLLKHFAAPSSWKAIADLARSDSEGVQLRRWLLEALDRLAAGRAIGWRELGDVVTVVAKHPDASLRDGVVGILVSLDRSDEKRRLLLEVLRTDDDEVVLASAVNALAGALPMELDPGLVERLLGHPSPRVQRSVRDLIERAKQTKP